MTSALTQIVETGYPHYRQAAGLPIWLMTEGQMSRVVGELGDEGITRLAEGLIHTREVQAQLAAGRTPVSDEAWQEGLKSWQPIGQIVSGAMAVLAAGERLLACRRQGRLLVRQEVVCRHLAVLFMAGVMPEGQAMRLALAGKLELRELSVSGLVASYADRVIEGDMALISHIEEHISSDPMWRDWSARFLGSIKEFPFTPKPVAIAPPPNGQLTDALVSMFGKGDR
jgi:hypothetical protein